MNNSALSELPAAPSSERPHCYGDLGAPPSLIQQAVSYGAQKTVLKVYLEDSNWPPISHPILPLAVIFRSLVQFELVLLRLAGAA